MRCGGKSHIEKSPSEVKLGSDQRKWREELTEVKPRSDGRK
jgi:hypothetical protein